MERTCGSCGIPIKGHKNRRFCGIACQPSNIIQRGQTSFYSDRLGRGTVGAIGELKVSIDLMERGYEVFHALSPHSSCDVLILKNGAVKTIEVRTGYRSGKGTLNYGNRGKMNANVLAVIVHSSGEIIYTPKI